MNRLLRKYNRILLAVFGVGLMIVFLMPQLPDLMAQFGGRGSLIATMGEDGEPVTREDWQMVQQQVQILQRLEGNLPPLPIIGSIGSDVQRYYLLIHEASKAGMIGGDGSVPLPPDAILTLSQQIGFAPAAVRQTLINETGIRRYLDHVARSGRLSDRRLRLESRRMLDGVDARYVVIPAEADASATAPTEADIEAQFSTYADVDPGEGDHGFGYRLPDRASIEWLEIPVASVRAAVTRDVAADDLDVRKFWLRNQAQFEDVDSSGDIPADVREAYVDQAVSEMLPTISRAAADTLRTPRRGFESAENFIVLPEDWDAHRVDLADLRTTIGERFNLPLEGDDAIPAPGQSDELIDLEEVRRLPRIGIAGTDRYGRADSGGRTRRLADLVGKAKELGGTGQVPVQVGVAGPVLEDPQGNLWVFRITDSDQARPPMSADEVRADVVADLQRLAAWKVLQEQAASMEAAAKTDGIDAIATARSQRVQGPRAFQRNLHPSIPRPPNVPGLGQDLGVIEAMVDRSIDLGTSPLADAELPDRVLVLPSDRNMAIIAVELAGRTPLRTDQFNQFMDQGVLTRRISADELGGPQYDNLQSSFTTDALATRHGFRFVGSDDEDGDTSTDDAADQATASAQ